MDIGTIDFWANNWDSVLHRASPISKIAAAALIVGAVVATDNLIVLVTIYLSIAAAVAFTRLPALKILMIGAYPGIFAVLFAISRWDGSFVTPTVIIVKALAAALAMLLLISTTSYPDIFALIQFFLPRIVADSLFLAYRSLFILLELMSNLVKALMLRGGFRRRHYIRNAKNLAYGLGLLLVRALALSERLYDVMRVRGYSGRLASQSRWLRATEYDIAPVGLSLWIISLAVAFRLWPEILPAYDGYFLSAAVLGLLLATVYARWPHPVPIKRR